MKLQEKLLSLIILITLMLMASLSNAQQFSLGKKHLTFELPNHLWHESSIDSNRSIKMYRTVFKREAVEAANRVLVIPNIEIVVEQTKMDLKQFSIQKQSAIDIKIDSNLYVKNGILQIKDAKAYFGHLKRGNVNYKMCIIQFVQNGYGVQIVMDCTSDIFDEVWVEFKYFVESLKVE